MSYDYHKLLKFLYFEGYADSYEEAEYLLEEISDEDYDYLIDEYMNLNERAVGREEMIAANIARARAPKTPSVKASPIKTSEPSTSSSGASTSTPSPSTTPSSSTSSSGASTSTPRSSTTSSLTRTPTSTSLNINYNPVSIKRFPRGKSSNERRPQGNPPRERTPKNQPSGERRPQGNPPRERTPQGPSSGDRNPQGNPPRQKNLEFWKQYFDRISNNLAS